MKKITRLSLVASLMLSSVAVADSLEEAFAKAKVKGELKAQYFNVKPTADGKSDKIIVVGGNLNLVTGSYNGLSAGLTFQTSHVYDISYSGTNNYAGTMDASGSVMSESYLAYNVAKTNIKVGRQYISTPLVAGSGSRMIKQSFEGITLVNTNLPATTLVAAYVSKFQGRTDNAGAPGKFTSYKDGAYTIYAKNNSVKNLTIQAQYLKENGINSSTDMNGQYLDATYNMNGVVVAAQYMGSKTGSQSRASLMGLKASGNLGMVNLTGIYTSTGSKGTVDPGAGSAADKSFTALPLHGGAVTYFANTDTMVAVAATKISGATVVAYVGQVKSPDNNNAYGAKKIDAVGGFVQYAFNKKASVKVMYESADFNTQKHDDDIFRVYTSYKF